MAILSDKIIVVILSNHRRFMCISLIITQFSDSVCTITFIEFIKSGDGSCFVKTPLGENSPNDFQSLSSAIRAETFRIFGLKINFKKHTVAFPNRSAGCSALPLLIVINANRTGGLNANSM